MSLLPVILNFSLSYLFWFFIDICLYLLWVPLVIFVVRVPDSDSAAVPIRFSVYVMVGVMFGVTFFVPVESPVR